MPKSVTSQLLKSYLINIAKRPIHYLKASFNILKLYQTNGLKGIKDLMELRVDEATMRNDYFNWVKEYNSLVDLNRLKEAQKNFELTPLISIVMPVFNPPRQMITNRFPGCFVRVDFFAWA